MKAYYNEFDPKAAAWLRQLIKSGLIADGVVDERSITEVSAADLRGFNQCHFFAGIGGWSYSLRLAGIPDDYHVWTASLPCQPFSAAGKQLGKADERHLLPHFLELVRQCQPHRIFGEQVEGAIRHGWLDDLQTNMEAEGYAVGHCVLGAHSVGSFHQRQRLYWVANANNQHGRKQQQFESSIGARTRNEFSWRSGIDGSMADANDTGSQGRSRTECTDKLPVGSGVLVSRMGNANSNRRETRSETTQATGHRSSTDAAGWNDPEWLYCRDNKYRPIKSSIKPLVDGLPRGMVYGSDPGEPIDSNATQEARVMRLKGYGNAIVPQVAAEFIMAATS